MNKYIVAYLSMFENELKQVMIEADNEIDAAYQYLAEREDILYDADERRSTLKLLIEDIFNMDGNLSVYKLD